MRQDIHNVKGTPRASTHFLSDQTKVHLHLPVVKHAHTNEPPRAWRISLVHVCVWEQSFRSEREHKRWRHHRPDNQEWFTLGRASNFNKQHALEGAIQCTYCLQLTTAHNFDEQSVQQDAV
jgi:hypothetical protein